MYAHNDDAPLWLLEELQRRLPPDFNISMALREAMHFGMELERAKHTHLDDPERCRKHLAPLRQIAPGLFQCPFQHVIARRPISQNTDPLPRIMPAKRYILERQRQEHVGMEDTQYLPIIRKEERHDRR